MRGRFVQQRRNDGEESEEPRFVVVKKIRDAILEETFKPGERLPEEQLGKMFNVSRTPVREALFALEKEGTMEPLKGATFPIFHDVLSSKILVASFIAHEIYQSLSATGMEETKELSKVTKLLQEVIDDVIREVAGADTQADSIPELEAASIKRLLESR